MEDDFNLPGFPNIVEYNGSSLPTVSNKRLVIIGNGFDLFHGLKSSLGDFLESVKSESYKDIFEFATDNNSLNEWSDIENTIFRAVEKSCQVGTLQEHPGIGGNYQEETNERVEEVNKLLIKYLSGEQDRVVLNGKYKISEHVKDKLKQANGILNFNYTETLQNIYKVDEKKIYYIHGSLKENRIIVGSGNEFPVSIRKYQGLSKSYLRDILAFRRWFQKKHDNSNVIADKIIKGFKDFDSYYYSWRKVPPVMIRGGQGVLEALYEVDGLYNARSKYFIDNAYESWKAREQNLVKERVENPLRGKMNANILKYASEIMFHPFKIKLPMGIHPEDIKEITIIGHSLKSDQEVIGDLLESAVRLKKVSLFVYHNESAEEINKQKEFIHRYSN